MEYDKGEILTEGKTKKIISVVDNSNLVIIQHKKTITAHDDPQFTQQFEGKDKFSTTTTCRIFELLQKAELPVAYIEQISPTEFVAPRCQMIPLEVVARLFAVGSYLKRFPELKVQEGQSPHQFPRAVIEFFLKTTKGELLGPNQEVLLKGLDPAQGEEDPLIANPNEQFWRLVHPKKPVSDPTADLKRSLEATQILGENFSWKMKTMEKLVTNVFYVLIKAWGKVDCRLIDMKIEFGLSDKDNQLLIADVIDNDSWRLRDKNWNELSKEVFRQGGDLATVANNYELVAKLVSQF